MRFLRENPGETEDKKPKDKNQKTKTKRQNQKTTGKEQRKEIWL